MANLKHSLRLYFKMQIHDNFSLLKRILSVFLDISIWKRLRFEVGYWPYTIVMHKIWWITIIFPVQWITTIPFIIKKRTAVMLHPLTSKKSRVVWPSFILNDNLICIFPIVLLTPFQKSTKSTPKSPQKNDFLLITKYWGIFGSTISSTKYVFVYCWLVHCAVVKLEYHI